MSQQCALLGLSRSSYYYEPATESVENLALMALIDGEYTAHPFLGSQGLTAWPCVAKAMRSIANGCSV